MAWVPGNGTWCYLGMEAPAQGCSLQAEPPLQGSWGQAAGFVLEGCCLDSFAGYSSIFYCTPCTERGPGKGEMDGTAGSEERGLSRAMNPNRWSISALCHLHWQVKWGNQWP